MTHALYILSKGSAHLSLKLSQAPQLMLLRLFDSKCVKIIQMRKALLIKIRYVVAGTQPLANYSPNSACKK